MGLKTWPTWKVAVAFVVVGVIVYALQTTTDGTAENIISIVGSAIFGILGVILAGRIMGIDHPQGQQSADVSTERTPAATEPGPGTD